jgi:pyruvate-formate lyase
MAEGRMSAVLKIRIEVDGEAAEFTDEQIAEEFAWHNMRDSNHCRTVRRKIFEALLALARTNK